MDMDAKQREAWDRLETLTGYKVPDLTLEEADAAVDLAGQLGMVALSIVGDSNEGLDSVRLATAACLVGLHASIQMANDRDLPRGLLERCEVKVPDYLPEDW